jgi:hypothetical protein
MPRIAHTKPRIRLNLDFTEQVKAQLESVRDRSNADSMTEVLRRALAVYDFLLSEQEQGSSLFLRTKDGVEQKVPLI